MFGWRKRSEGFEWQEYVRTTILVRRADRQKRMDDARLAALAKVKDTADRGIDAGKKRVEAVQDVAKGAALRAGDAAAAAAKQGARAALSNARKLERAVSDAFQRIPRDKLNMPPRLKSAGRIAAMYATDMPRRWRIAKKYIPATAAAAAAIWGFGAVLAPQTSSVQSARTTSGITTGSTASASNATADNDANRELQGRARAVSGNVLKVNDTLLRLAGIEAPDPAQPCFTTSGKRWPCGDAAEGALGRLVRNHKVVCEVSGTGKDALPLANCRAGDKDLASELVRGGHVFASEGYFRAYGNEEEAARSAKLGLWQGQTERPDAWRARIWDEAKRNAPDGCPIKGSVRSSGRIYTMPWSDDYDRRSVKAAKGERWFCSEDEARAAGFRLPSRS